MKRLLTTARILIFLLAAFFAVFSPEAILKDTLINLIPTFILMFILLSSWKFPRIATLLLLITTLTFTFFFTTYDYYLKFLVISLPLIIATIIFLFHIIQLQDRKTDNEEEYDD